MYIQVTESMFHDQFFKFDRQDNFSYSARSMLFDYLTAAEDNGQNGEAGLELDIIAICCDFTESTIEEFINDYQLQEDDSDISEMSDDDLKRLIENYINDNSIFIGWSSDDSFVYACF